jgi:hypothetical protein
MAKRKLRLNVGYPTWERFNVRRRNMPHPVVKVQKDEFRKFLEDSKEVSSRWVPDNTEFEQFVSRLPCDIDELMSAIEFYPGQECKYIYVFNSNEDDPEDACRGLTFSDETLPEAMANELDEYVVRSSMGKDFLYFACSLEEASCIRYTTLLPGDSPEFEGNDLD